MIYLASPYSHPDAEVLEQRFKEVCRIAGDLMREGEIVFSPIAHSHPIAMTGDLPLASEYWEKYNRAWLAACSSLVICMMDGWDMSKGIAAEIRIAKEFSLPVEYLDPYFLKRVTGASCPR